MKSAELPPGQDGYARVVRLADGAVVALVVTADRLSPERRAQVRRELLARCLGADPDAGPVT